MDIVFVILHYCTLEDTIACIESIRSRIDTRDYHIVAVDNHSANGSLEILQKEYAGAQDVTLLANSENLGFANGLNAGIDYARSHFDPDYIALINNDTQLVSSGFTRVLNIKHEQYGFAVLGPMIITGEGLCNVNPILTQPRDAQNVQKAIDRYQRIYRICSAHLYGIYTALKKLRPKKPAQKKLLHLSDLTDCKLHGSFWILSRDYFTAFNGLNPKTFLFGEEDILYLSVLKAGLHTLYTPDISVYHKENSSTDAAMPDSAERTKFICKYSMESLGVYLKLLEEENVSKDK